jgi:16S rRNA (uracil1498-N3)-methyltransferase
VAAAEQCGRTRVPVVLPPQPLRDWLAGQPASLPVSLPPDGLRLVLSLADGTQPLRQRLAAHGGGPVSLLSGPEGGLSPAELAAAAAAGHLPTTLGARVLRADTAPLAALAVIAALESPA